MMKKHFFLFLTACICTCASAQTQTAYLDLYLRGGGKNLRTTLIFDENPINLGRKNLGEALNMFAQMGWEVDHSLIGAHRLSLFPTRHKFHVILRKEYRTGEDPFARTTSTESIAKDEFSPAPQFLMLTYETIDNQPISKILISSTDSYTDGIGGTVHTDKHMIESGTFSGCQNIMHVDIKDNIFTIAKNAFGNCPNLTSATIPKSVSFIDDNAFISCDRLNTVYCKAITPPRLGINIFLATSIEKIYVPRNSVNAYKQSKEWNEYAEIIEGYDFK